MQVNEADWKLFRQKLPGWQEAHMEKLVKEYAAVIAGSGKASDKFWELEKRIREDKRKTAVLARDIRRSNMLSLMMDLIHEGAISADDLDGFSKDLQDRLLALSQWA